jgi:predicted AlkP superfamily pyrophosphatase or phosphodiesterase
MKPGACAWMLATLASSMAAMAVASAVKPQRPIPEVEHIVLISVDGLRPDLALRANMPTLRGMLRDGSFTFWARTTDVSITLPSHTSMVTGVSPSKHGVTWNDGGARKGNRYPLVPTVMEIASRAGYVTAMVAGKSKFAALARPGVLTCSFVPAVDVGLVNNEVVVMHTEECIAEYKPNLLFVHLPDVDSAGHRSGWGSAEQIAALEKTDIQVGRIFEALKGAGMRPSTVVILSADHGGAAHTHGPNDVRSQEIPWIIDGPGIRPDYDLSQAQGLSVHTEDTAATILYLLGLPRAAYLQGRPVMAALDVGSVALNH